MTSKLLNYKLKKLKYRKKYNIVIFYNQFVKEIGLLMSKVYNKFSIKQSKIY